MAPKPQERAKAKAEGKTRYYTGKPCKHGHVAERQTSNGTCTVCSQNRNSQWAKDNPDKVYRNQLAYLKRYPERREAYIQQYLMRNREKRREDTKRWRLLNSDKHASKQKKREAAKINRTPSWLSKTQNNQIDEMYWLAADLKAISGQKYHVDHIVPLQGKNISGLHVPWNLQILPADMNCKKSNTFEGEIKW